MRAGPPTVVEMLTQRLQVVQEISAAQSRNLLNRQLGGGAEFEIQCIEQEIAASGCSRELARTSRMRASAYERQMPRWQNATLIAPCWSSALKNWTGGLPLVVETTRT